MDSQSPTAAVAETATEFSTPSAPSPIRASSPVASAAAPAASSTSRSHLAIESLLAIISTIPPIVASSDDPATALLHDEEVATQISGLLRQPHSGSGDNPLCRWLYDTFQTTDPPLQLVVLRFLPTIAGIYLSRVAHDRCQAGFEAVLLALYSHETTARGGESVSVNLPELSHPSIYHESKDAGKSNATELHLAVISPSLEPYGTVRSTRRARIVGVALELYYSKISHMPIRSKLDLSEFCVVWSGLDGSVYSGYGADNSEVQAVQDPGPVNGEEDSRKEKLKVKTGRITLPWELLQPVLRILGHCLLGPVRNKELHAAACTACRSLHSRSLHDINPKAILATESLLSLSKMAAESENDPDPTELSQSNIIIL
ncbi:hypothetical protein SAY87_019489 [Trapa incisa]|uniref:Hyccin n=1 Tax=Trapa incisa TaxID=236973 RepID=A0AAN7JZC0_9MYRT|nr:hypothetical protein SAY87_019489 [Trapa incisa]